LFPLFGLAGLAEAAEAQALVLGWCGLVVLGMAAAVGLLFRVQVAAGLASCLAALMGVMCVPWSVWLPIESADPDVHYWGSAWREFGGTWAVMAVATLAASARAFRSSKQAPPRGS
jgi:hypothetical protein